MREFHVGIHTRSKREFGCRQSKLLFANLKANRSMRTVPFARPVTARYFRFVGLHAVAANHLRLAELGVVENQLEGPSRTP